MLASLLPLIESLGAEGGAASALSGSRGIGSVLSNLLSGSNVKAFGSQNELGSALKQISDLTSNLSAAKEAMSSMRDEHDQLAVKAREDEKFYGFRDPQEQQRMADLQRSQIEHARQMQLQQEQMQSLQARAALSLDPALAAQQSRSSMFRQAGGAALAGTAVKSFGPGFLRSLPGVEAASNVGSFLAGPTNANIAGQMASTATSGASNILGSSMQGASLGSLAGPEGAVIGAVLGGLGAASTEIAKLPLRITDWSKELLDSQRTISRFSGVMAQADAMADVKTLQRNIRSAHATGGSTADLSQNYQNLMDQIQPARDVATNVIAGGLSEGIKILSDLVSCAKGILACVETLPGVGPALTDWLKKIEKNTSEDKRKGAEDLGRTIRKFLAEDPMIPRSPARR